MSGRIFGLVFMSACGLALPAIGQPVSVEAATALNSQWMDAKASAQCVQALTLYAGHPDSADAALQALSAGQPKRTKDIYAFEAKQGSLWYLLATATQFDLVDTAGKQVANDDVMFASAGATLQTYYKSKLSKLAAVAAEKNQLKALSLLLNLVSVPDDEEGKDPDPAAERARQQYKPPDSPQNIMQCFRACYKREPNRLFRLINNLLS